MIHIKCYITILLRLLGPTVLVITLNPASFVTLTVGLLAVTSKVWPLTSALCPTPLLLKGLAGVLLLGGIIVSS